MISPQLNNDVVIGCPLLKEYGVDIHFGAIIDTGSEVNLISEKAFKLLSDTGEELLILPVENVRLVTAFGKRSKKIKNQTLLRFKLKDYEFEGVYDFTTTEQRCRYWMSIIKGIWRRYTLRKGHSKGLELISRQMKLHGAMSAPIVESELEWNETTQSYNN
jgi:hypothetical protein